MKKEKWIKLIEEWEQSSLSITNFCRQKNINKSTFYMHRKRKKASEEVSKKVKEIKKMDFNEVLAKELSPISPSTFLKISFPNGLQLEIPICEI